MRCERGIRASSRSGTRTNATLPRWLVNDSPVTPGGPARQYVVVKKSILAFGGQPRARTCRSTQLATAGFAGFGYTLTPAARPFCTATRTVTFMLSGAPQPLMNEALRMGAPS